MKIFQDKKVVLIAGPAGSGKTSMGSRIAKNDGWVHISEDKVWDELQRNPHTFRTDAEKAIVQARTVEYIKAQLEIGINVALDFIVYDNPPQPIIFYQSELNKLGVPIYTKVLRPSVDEILIRQAMRSNAHDTERDLADRRTNAEHQIRCVSSEFIDPNWVVNSTGISIEDVYNRYFAGVVDSVKN